MLTETNGRCSDLNWWLENFSFAQHSVGIQRINGYWLSSLSTNYEALVLCT